MTEKKFGNDVHIPSDTEAFDNKVTEMRRPRPISPEREKLNMEFGLLASRLAAYANFHNQNMETLGPLDVQNYVQMVVTNCQLMEFSTMLQDKLAALAKCFLDAKLKIQEGYPTSTVFAEAAACLHTTDIELFTRTVKTMEDHIQGIQKQLNVSITAEGVFKNAQEAGTSEIPESGAGGDAPELKLPKTDKPN